MSQNEGKLRVPYALAVFGEEERRAVIGVLETPQIVAGVKSAEFEEKIAALFSKKYGLFLNSGSSANLLALEMLQLPEGSEVVTPVLTFATTVAPILQKKLVPVFVDVDMGRYTVNIDQIEEMITGKTKALMIPSLFGNIPDYPRLRRVADRHNLILIEDSCDTLGATISGKSTGIYSHVSTTSFYASHVITAAGMGGMLCTDNAEWMRTARILSGWGRRSALNETEEIEERMKTTVDGKPYDSKFIFEGVGYNLRCTDISAAFGLEQLKKIDQFSAARIQNFKTLKGYFKKYSRHFVLPEQAEGICTNWIAFPLIVRCDAGFSRMEIVKYLEENNIQTRPLFSGNLLRQPGFQGIPCVTRKEGYPVADAIMENGFVVGCNHGLKEQHMTYLMQVFDDFLGKR